MATAADEYDELAALLARDPDNRALLAEAAEAAYAAGRYDETARLTARHRALAGRTPAIDHLAGVSAMATGDWAAAIECFEALGSDPGVRFNRAWSLAMAGRKDEALALLDEDMAATIPQAAQLLVGLLHERGEMGRAGAVARDAVERFPDHRGLNAAVSTLAIDTEDPELARACALRAGDHPAALATLGALALEQDRPGEAATLFDDALRREPGNARARVGRGLVALTTGDHPLAAKDLDHGAELFGTHLGSWIAAGWAYVLAGDQSGARERFERARSIDDSFAEAHGSLAVLDLLAGDAEAGARGLEVARRLDRESFSAALAAALLAASAGDAAQAERIVTLALSTPIDAAGRTVGRALARLGARG